jgi:hypothetical protein
MRKEDSLHILPPDFELGEALQGTPPRVEEELLPSSFDQNARPEAMHDRRGTAGTQKSDFDFLPLGRGWDKSHEHENNTSHSPQDAREHITPPQFGSPTPAVSRA